MAEHDSSEDEFPMPPPTTLSQMIARKAGPRPPPLPDHLRELIMIPGPAPWIAEANRQRRLTPYDPVAIAATSRRARAARKAAEEEEARKAAKDEEAQKAAEEEEARKAAETEEVQRGADVDELVVGAAEEKAASQAVAEDDVEMQEVPAAEAEKKIVERNGLAGDVGLKQSALAPEMARPTKVEKASVVVPSKRRHSG